VERKGRPPGHATATRNATKTNRWMQVAGPSNSALNPRFLKISKVKMPSFLGRDGTTKILFTDNLLGGAQTNKDY
jgi:hypothetical protein